jgi:menaquinone-dependent protoporphyrinogen IX oxidase
MDPEMSQETQKKMKILIAYATDSSSTAEVAKSIAEEIGKTGASVEVLPVGSVTSLEGFSAVVVGAPEIVGWHRQAKAFIQKNEMRLSQIPVAYFVTLMSLTLPEKDEFKSIPIVCDPELTHEPTREGKLSIKERYASVENYLTPILKAAPSVKPVGVAFFGGKLTYYGMSWLKRLFVMVIIQANPGDRRNWDFIRAWAAGIAPLLKPEK